MSERSHGGSKDHKETVARNSDTLADLLGRVTSNEEGKYVEACANLEKVLKSERVYHKEAQSIITNIIDAAYTTLSRCNVEFGFNTPYNPAVPGPMQCESRRQAYLAALKTIVPHINLFYNERDRDLLVKKAEEAGFIEAGLDGLPVASGSNLARQIPFAPKSLSPAVSSAHSPINISANSIIRNRDLLASVNTDILARDTHVGVAQDPLTIDLLAQASQTLVKLQDYSASKVPAPLPQLELTGAVSIIKAIEGLLSSTHEDSLNLLSEKNVVELLDVLQDLIDSSTPDRRTYEKYLSRLVSKSGIFPSRLFVHGVHRIDEYPVTGGGFADIWRGQVENQVVALKVLRIFGWYVEKKDAYKEFCTEALLWRQLNHPNILPFLGICTDVFSPRYAMVSPWMSSGDLSKYLKNNPTCNRLHLITGVTCGLYYLHSLNPVIIHGDLRGANVLIDANGQPRLADFGLSRVVDSQASRISTSSHGGKGNVRWLAPELLDPASFEKEKGRVTTKSDIYSLACVYLEIFTDAIPFSYLRADAAIIVEVVLNRAHPRRPHEPANQRGLSDHIWNIMQLCWSFQPVQRPDAQMILERLQNKSEGAISSSVQNASYSANGVQPESSTNTVPIIEPGYYSDTFGLEDDLIYSVLSMDDLSVWQG